MKDRVSRYPGRVRLTPVAGQEGLYDMERADEPAEPGTPLNKATLLSDNTASLFGLGATATPDAALAAAIAKINSNKSNADNRFANISWARMGAANLTGLKAPSTFTIALNKSVATFEELLIYYTDAGADSTYGGIITLLDIQTRPIYENGETIQLVYAMPNKALGGKYGGANQAVTFIRMGKDRARSTVTSWHYSVGDSTNSKATSSMTGFQADLSSVTTSLSGSVYMQWGGTITSGTITVYGRKAP